MEAILKELLGKKVDVNCGSSAAYRGEVVSADGGILKIVNEEQQDIYIAVEKIAAISECKDFGVRPGFIG